MNDRLSSLHAHDFDNMIFGSMNSLRLTGATFSRCRRQVLRSVFAALSAVIAGIPFIEPGLGATPDAIVADIKTVIEICRSGDATDSLEAHFLDAKKNRRFLRDSPEVRNLITLRSGESFFMEEHFCSYSPKITSGSIYDIAEMLGMKRSFVRTIVAYDKSETLAVCADKGTELRQFSKKDGTKQILLYVSYVGAEFRTDVDCSSGPSRPEKLNNHDSTLK